MRLRKKIMAVSASLVLIAALTWLFGQVEAADIQGFVADFGAWAPAVYMGLFALLPAVFFPVAVLALAGGLLISLTGEDLLTSFSASYASLGNVGPGFGKVGSVDNFASLTIFAKMVCTTLMLLGRLEIFGFIHLLFLHSWR